MSAHVNQKESRHPYTFGPLPLPDGRVRFQFWAPGARTVALVLASEPPLPMQRDGEGFFNVEASCEPGASYCFCIDGGQHVPDPASREQEGDVHGKSLLPDPAYRWRTAGWRGRPWTETVLYEIHVGLLGGFRGVQERLPDLAELGVTAIELMPVADFSGPRNWGYDGVLPYAPDAAYGCPDELKELVDTAHSLGLQVFLDVVYNHFGPDGNYLHVYAPQFFREDIQTPWGPAVDFRRPQVRAFFAENALYWLREYRMDGLRLDAVHAIDDKSWLPEMAAFVRSRLGPDRHVHLVLENDDNAASLLRQGFDAQWNDDIHHVLHHMLTGESGQYYADYADHAAARLARCLTQGFDYQGQASALRHGARRGEPSADLPPSAFVFFLQNHDQTGNRAHGERLTTLCADKPMALLAAIALQLLTPQVPLLFMGEEYGATAPFLYFTSFADEDLARAVCEGRRKEFAGLAEAREAVPDPNDPATWEASLALPALQQAQGQEWRAYYGTLLRVRREYITPYLAQARALDAQVLGPQAVQAAWRMGNGDTLRLYCNLSSDAVKLPARAPAGEQVIYAGRHTQAHADRPETMLPQDTFATMTPGSA